MTLETEDVCNHRTFLETCLSADHRHILVRSHHCIYYYIVKQSPEMSIESRDPLVHGYATSSQDYRRSGWDKKEKRCTLVQTLHFCCKLRSYRVAL